MILSNVNIGTGPSAGDGDPLRTAFNTINENFERIESNVNALTNSVSSVAGRTGNIVLTTQDIIGINNYATVSYVNSQLANAGAANISSLQSNVAALQADVNTLYGNAGVQSATLATLTANAALQAGSLATLTSNAASQAGELTTLLSNAAVQAGEIASLLSNAGSQHEAISSLQSNAAVQAGLIAALQANVGVSNYGNSNVAVYLTTYAGNVRAGNIIFDDLSVQTTAYTGTQWRSNLESNVRVKPSWLSYVPGGKNQEGTQYGFDTGGMFFRGNSDGDFAYPIQTNLHFHEQDVLEVIATIYFGATNNDHGLCIFPADGRPIWQSSANTTRIAFQYTAGIPVLYGQTTANTAPGSPVLSTGNYYTIKFKYDPGNTVVVETFSGNTATGSPVDTRSLAEVLPAGDYRLGFDADNDASGVKSYWTNLIVRTLTNTVVNDLEVQGQVIGNLIPQSNVSQSLGNITHQWKDLWVSNNTIYINSVPLSIDAGGNLLINGAPVSGGAGSTADITFANTSISAADDSEITVDAKTAERIRAKLRLEPTSGDAYLEAWSGQNTRSENDTNWTTGVWENNIYGNPLMTFTGAFDLAFFVVNTLQSSADPDTVSYSINGGPYIAWDGGSSADTTTGYVQINTSGVSPNVSPTAITSLDWRYAYKSSMGISHGNGSIQITGRNQYLQVDIDQYILVNSKGSIEFNNSNYSNNVDIELRSGDDILLQAKDKTTSDSEGGDINIYAGDGGDADAGDSAGGGGDITIRAGDGGAPSAAYNGGLGGTLELYGGFGSDANPGFNRSARNGGIARLVAGSAGGNSGNIALGAVGGPVEITAGQTTLQNSNGGIVTITSGQGGANALAGNVEINTPSSDLGSGGTWTFDGKGQLTLPGNVISGNGQVNFVANSSGDGNGYSTIELRPDVNQAGTDQYLIVDPTAPGHIHIRAGGEQDNSSADLIFGGENSHVRIPAGANTAPYIKSNGYEWQFGTDGILTLAAGGSIYAPVNDPIDIRVRDSGNVGYAIEQSVRDGTGTLQTLTSLDRQEFKIYTDFQGTNNIWTFAKSGQFSLAGNLRFPDSTVQTTAWTGTVAYGNTIAIGYSAGLSSQGNEAVAIGRLAGNVNQGGVSVAIGRAAGRDNQGIEAVSLGVDAGQQNQGDYGIAIGSVTAYLNQGAGAVAIGTSAGAVNQGTHAIAIGTGAGNGNQGNSSIILNATGSPLDQSTDNTFTVKPIRGASAGNILYYDPSSGEITYSTLSVTYGNTIALGYSAGVDQGEFSVAIGSGAGNDTQGNLAIAVGKDAGLQLQGDYAIGIGNEAGWISQSTEAVAVGVSAGRDSQGISSVAVGAYAGSDTQGSYSVAIGPGAGSSNQPANSIIINASVDSLNASTTGLFVNPIRNTTGNVGVLQYNNVTKEVSYSSNVTLGNVTAGNVRANNNVHFGTGNARITSDDNTSILLTPDTAANGLAGVKIGGNGYLLASNGARNITLNYGSVNGAVGLQANVTVGTSASSILTVNGNVTANNISTIGSILSTGASGKIGYSAGGYVVQSGNTSGVTLNTVSGNIQLDTVNIAVNTSHTVALTNNKLDASDIILVQGQDSSALDLHIGAYYLTTNTAIIYLRNISGSSIGPIAPMLKFIIVKAPGS